MQSNFKSEQVTKTHISCEDYSGEKAVVVSRLINSKLYCVTIQDSYDIEEYPRANNVCTYFQITDEMFIKVSDRKPTFEEVS